MLIWFPRREKLWQTGDFKFLSERCDLTHSMTKVELTLEIIINSISLHTCDNAQIHKVEIQELASAGKLSYALVMNFFSLFLKLSHGSIGQVSWMPISPTLIWMWETKWWSKFIEPINITELYASICHK